MAVVLGFDAAMYSAIVFVVCVFWARRTVDNNTVVEAEAIPKQDNMVETPAGVAPVVVEDMDIHRMSMTDMEGNLHIAVGVEES